MKSIRTGAVIIIAAIAAAAGTSACYEPIANTSSDGGDSSADPYRSEVNEPEPLASGSDTKESEPVQQKSEPVTGGFRANVEANLKANGLALNEVVDGSSAVESRIFREYGAVLLTRAAPPTRMMFTSEGAVTEFQAKAGASAETIAGTRIELQPSAMEALKKAIVAAKAEGVSITPRDGAEAGRRTYGKTLELWNSRFLKACDHWKGKGRLTADQVARLKSLPIKEQVDEVLKLEETGIYFNTFFNNSILFSVAAPGTSQHLSMLALDVSEFADARVRKVLASHGWFRTVQNDEPHFTYLGLEEAKLSSYGLKQVNKNGGEYWIPDV